jgi:hypothetical protein
MIVVQRFDKSIRVENIEKIAEDWAEHKHKNEPGNSRLYTMKYECSFDGWIVTYGTFKEISDPEW